MDSTYRNTCEFQTCKNNSDTICLNYGRMGFIGKFYAWHDFELVSIIDEKERLELPRICRADVSLCPSSSSDKQIPLMLEQGPINASPPKEIEAYVSPSGIVCQRGLKREIAAAQTSYAIDRSMSVIGLRNIYQQNFLPSEAIMRPSFRFQSEKHLFKNNKTVETKKSDSGEKQLLSIVLRYSCPSQNIQQLVDHWIIDHQHFFYQIKQDTFGKKWWKSYQGKMPMMEYNIIYENNIMHSRSHRRISEIPNNSQSSKPILEFDDITILENATMVAEKMHEATYQDNISSNNNTLFTTSNTIGSSMSTSSPKSTDSNSLSPLKLDENNDSKSSPSDIIKMPADNDIIIGTSGKGVLLNNTEIMAAILKKKQKPIEFKKVKIVDILNEEPINDSFENYNEYNKENVCILIL